MIHHFLILVLFYSVSCVYYETVEFVSNQTIAGKALTDYGNVQVKAYSYDDGTIAPLKDVVVYFYSPESSKMKAFCKDGMMKRTDDNGIASCDLILGFVVGEDGKFRASFHNPEYDEHELVEDYWVSTVSLHIASKIYWKVYIQMGVILSIVILSSVVTAMLCVYVYLKPKGTKKMREIAGHIASGSNGFLLIQYATIAVVSIPVAIILFVIFLFRRKSGSDVDMHGAFYGLIISGSFLFGVFCSALSGFIGMFVAVRTNIRVAAAAMKSYRECVNVAIRGGMFAAFCFVNLSVMGVFVMFGSIFLFVPQDIVNPMQLTTIIIGFSFGASFCALFSQLGGGIFTKAADLGADISGKLESKIPEDDVRNPAVVADLVGDNVGDCAGRGADLFESISANCFGTMILGATLAYQAVPQIGNVYQIILFPLLVLVFGMIASFIGLMFVQVRDIKTTSLSEQEVRDGNYENMNEDEESEGIHMDVHTDVQLRNANIQEEEDDDESVDEHRQSSTDGDGEMEDDKSDEEMEGGEMFDDERLRDVPFGEESDGGLGERNSEAEHKIEDLIESQMPEGGTTTSINEALGGANFFKTMLTCQNPVVVIGIGFMVTYFLNLFFFTCICFWCFFDMNYPHMWWLYSLCGFVGVTISFLFIFITVYYTDYQWRPTKNIARACETGAATNIITGQAMGMESTFPSILVICTGILMCYYLGYMTGVEDIYGVRIGGYLGIGVGTMGLLSTSAFILSMDTFGPIADNAGGIVEMAGLPQKIRDITDRLDAVGNTTKALTKGYAIATAGFAGCLLFFAFLDTVSNYCEQKIDDINISRPEVFVGGLLGAGAVYIFVSITFGSVGKAAHKIVKEVRRQFKQHPGILEGTELPDYKRCVSYCTLYSLMYMIVPGLLGCLSPVLVGFAFRFLGLLVDDDLLGVKVGTGFMIVATITSVLMGMFLNNAGGAWDNAKKYVETGAHGGKGSDAHMASIVGDTVGDPFKDTAGPSLHVLIKLIATVGLVIGPLWVNPSAIKG